MAEKSLEGLPPDLQELVRPKPEATEGESLGTEAAAEHGEVPPTKEGRPGERSEKKATPLPLSRKKRALVRGLKSVLLAGGAIVAMKWGPGIPRHITAERLSGMREKNATAGWTELLQHDIGSSIESVLEAHLTSNVDPDDYRKWTGRFGEEARALVDVTQKALTAAGREELKELGNKQGMSIDELIKYADDFEKKNHRLMSWEDLRAYLKNNLGMSEQYLKIIDELRKESLDSKHDGKVRDALKGRLSISSDWRPAAIVAPDLKMVQRNVKAKQRSKEGKIERGRFRG